MIQDKINRLRNLNVDSFDVKYVACNFTDKKWINRLLDSAYNRNEKSFNSLLGISYYLSEEDFFNMIKSISDVISKGSSVIFDYPTYEESKESVNNEILAGGANEKMKSKYSYEIIEFYRIMIYIFTSIWIMNR